MLTTTEQNFEIEGVTKQFTGRAEVKWLHVRYVAHGDAVSLGV